jgi:hypothetical protein
MCRVYILIKTFMQRSENNNIIVSRGEDIDLIIIVFFYINVDVSINVCAPRLISQALKLTTM